MAYVRGGAKSFFTEESYQKYLKEKSRPIETERLRPENETIFDAMQSVKLPKKAIDIICGYNGR